MKKLILILLFLPLMSIGQDMTYEDLMGFENNQQVERFLIERNYQRYDYDDKEFIKYAYDLSVRDGENWYNKGATFPIELGYFMIVSISFAVVFDFFEEEDYNRIYDVAKKELKFASVNEGIAYYTGEETMVGFQKEGVAYNIVLMKFKEEDLLEAGELLMNEIEKKKMEEEKEEIKN